MIGTVFIGGLNSIQATDSQFSTTMFNESMVGSELDRCALGSDCTFVKERILASILLAAVGDAIGFRNGTWEFNKNSHAIHKELKHYYGDLNGIDTSKWRVSDDTVMHLATLKAMISFMENTKVKVFKFDESDEKMNIQFLVEFVDPLMKEMAKEYLICWGDMYGRAPGPTCEKGVNFIHENGVEYWFAYPYDKRGGGNGGSMRAMGIGVLTGEERRDMLIAASIESGRLTHNHPTGFLGALVSALFTSYALEGKIPPSQWGVHFLHNDMPRARIYLKTVAKRDWKEMQESVTRFENAFRTYLKDRNLYLDENEFKNADLVNNLKPSFPSRYGIDERDQYYRKYAFDGWNGASGDDSVIIAYDSILYSGPNNYENLILQSCLHSGDSDSTGSIACSWYGAKYGFSNTIESHTKNIEKRAEMEQIAQKLHHLYH